MGKHILIVDPDPETARLLASPLRERGHQVSAARNGARAIEIATREPPDLVLLDAAGGPLEAQTFRQSMRALPYAAQPTILATGTEANVSMATWQDGFLLKPFNVDEVLARLDQLLRRADAARSGGAGEEGMEGTLRQLALTDLLQVLGQGRKSGLLDLSGPRGRGRIRLRQGRVAEAQSEGVIGPKALFRLLPWKEGHFSFVPLENSEPGDIDGSIEELLLEGLRQTDELPALRAELPEPATRLAPKSPGVRVSGGPEVAAEILELARKGSTVDEILGRSRATDHAVAKALLTLLRKGVLVPAPGPPQPDRASRPLLPPGGAQALRDRVSPGTRGKLLVAASDPTLLPPFLEMLRGVSECRLEEAAVAEASASQFGTLGAIEAGDGLVLDLLLLPAQESASPLWQPFSVGAFGAVVLLRPGAAAGAAGMLAFLSREQQIPTVLPGVGESAELARLAPRAVPLPEGPGLRELFALAVQSGRPPASLQAQGPVGSPTGPVSR
jgi:CheY-like chemotaxis protein